MIETIRPYLVPHTREDQLLVLPCTLTKAAIAKRYATVVRLVTLTKYHYGTSDSHPHHTPCSSVVHSPPCYRWWTGGREGGREGWREGGREEAGREGGRELLVLPCTLTETAIARRHATVVHSPPCYRSGTAGREGERERARTRSIHTRPQ